MIYPDLTALLSLLVPGQHSQEAAALLTKPGSVPLALSIVHRLQVENSLVRFLHGSEEGSRTIARDGLLLWRRYLDEGVFELRSFPLADAFARAAAWNAAWSHQPPRWHLMVHVALAAEEGAAFLSLDPILRKKASRAGLTLVPAKL